MSKNKIIQTTDFSSKSEHNFEQWLVGVTEGDGCFFIDQQRTKNPNQFKWNLGYKLAFTNSNIQGLIYVKKMLNCGIIDSGGKNMKQYRIRNRKHLLHILFPIFDRNPMLSSKNTDYLLVREAAGILENNQKSAEDKNKEILELTQSFQSKKNAISVGKSKPDISPIWYKHLPFSRVKALQSENWSGICFNEVFPMVSDSWLRGFFEAEGSFYITKKESGRFCHGFGITQKNPQLLHVIRARLHIVAKVQSFRNYYKLDTTNRRVLGRIQKLCHKKLFSAKSLEFRIWERTLHFNSNDPRLVNAQKLIRKIRIRSVFSEICNPYEVQMI